MHRHFTATRLLSALATTTFLLFAAPAHAQSIIKQPGNHPDYGLELDPHLVAQYADVPYTNAGIGVGMRFSIPFVKNGPITTINNNIGISFGLDWAHFGDDGLCHGRGYAPFYPNTCNGDEVWFPVTAQWNFFLTRIISVFGEFGLAAHYTSWGYDGPCDVGGGNCTYHTHNLDLFEPVFWGGGRFLFSRKAGLTVRLGWPYLSVGASILF
jgi:hypothetical protein